MPEPRFAKLRVALRKEETPELTLLRIDGAEPELLAAHRRPGQYVAVRLPEAEKPAHFAIASAPGERWMELLVRGGGRFADTLRALRMGDTVEVSEPAGRGFPLEAARGRDLWLVGVGSGIAALRPVVRLVVADPALVRRAHIVFGARAAEDIPFRDEMDGWRGAGIDVHLALSGGTDKVYVQDALARLAPDLDQAELFAVGMRAMIDAVRQTAAGLKLAPPRFHTNH